MKLNILFIKENEPMLNIYVVQQRIYQVPEQKKSTQIKY